MTRVHLTLKSANAKVGPIPVSTTSADTCPDACPMKSSGECYAKSGPLALHWAQVTNGTRGMTWNDFTTAIAALPEGQLWRHNQAGDLPGVGDTIDTGELKRLVTANAGRRGFTYTHKPLESADNLAAVRDANARGFTVNASADNLAEADQLAQLGVPVVVVVPSDAPDVMRSPDGRRVIVCHEQTGRKPNCAACQLCAVAPRFTIVAFRAHGAKKAQLSSRTSLPVLS